MFKFLLHVVAALSAAFQCSEAKAEHYRIWVKAFIPNIGLNIVKPVPNLDGHYMIPGPHLAGIPVDDSCYNTNDRSFSDDIDADAKITVGYDFDVFAPGVANVTARIPPAGDTTRYDCDSGRQLATGQATTDDLKLGEVDFDKGVVRFTVDGEAANPLISLPSSLVPSIKIHGVITVNTNKRSIAFKGFVAKFPSYECYVSIDDGAPIPVFKISPESDATAWSLMVDRDVDETVSY